jgi:hypothetical protein
MSIMHVWKSHHDKNFHMLFQSRRDVLTETKYVELILVNDNSQVSISPLQINEIRCMKQVLLKI